jgi:putative solute:sodium symporter small subunit
VRAIQEAIVRQDNEFREVSFLRPKKGYMRGEVGVILLILLGWAIVPFGFQLLLMATATTPAGDGPLTTFTFFTLPFHFWFTGQYLPLWFIFLCIVFNLFIDRLTELHSRRRERFYD